MNANLTRVAVYRRTIRASLDRVWENVLDWEHLPWLHREAFAEIELRQAGAWGWRARAVTAQHRELELELLVEREASRYVARTLEGDHAGSEIWTRLRARALYETDIEVEFWLPDVPTESREKMGSVYTRLYTQLWDEDEAMMREREVRLVSRRVATDAALTAPQLLLGGLDSLRGKLPLRIEFAGEPVWLVELNGALACHTAVCPHRLGPLPPAGLDEDRSATVQCPWHGYRFDVRTGASCDGQRLAMKTALRVVVEGGQVRLVVPEES